MKVGSIVTCINNDPFKTKVSLAMYAAGYTFPELNAEYVVRGFQEGSSGNILLEEIVNETVRVRYTNTNETIITEMGFGDDRFRELLPPQTEELKQLMSEVNSMPLFEVYK